MRIGIDIDDTITNSWEYLKPFYAKEFSLTQDYLNNCKQLHCNDSEGCMILYKLDYLYNEAGISLALRKPRELFIDADGTDRAKFTQLKQIQDNILEFVNNGHQLFLHSLIVTLINHLFS